MDLNSLRKLDAMTDRFDVIYPSHYTWPLGTEAIGLCLNDAVALAEGRLTDYERHPFMPCNIYRGSYTSFLYQPV